MATDYGKTKEFIFDNGTFFSAKTTLGNVRIGMNNIRAFDLPKSHRLYAAALVANSEEKVEVIFDALMSA